MELWIRSQDRENLIHANEVGYLENSLGEEILNYVITTNNIWVGGYATKERALEVLDEIQNVLMPKCIINSKSMKFSGPYEENGIVLMDCNANARIEELSTYVYEMPKE